MVNLIFTGEGGKILRDGVEVRQTRKKNWSVICWRAGLEEKVAALRRVPEGLLEKRSTREK